MMNNGLVERLKTIYQAYYDLKEPPAFVPFPLDLYAHFYQKNEKYFASKRITLWRMEHDEHCLVKVYEEITPDDIDVMTGVLQNGIDYLVKPGPEHMKTFLTGVFITRTTPSPEILQMVKKFKCGKAFKFYFHGWCDIRLVVVDLFSQQVITNAAGQEVRKFYEVLLGNINKENKEVRQ